MQFWYDTLPIVFACILCGFLGTHSYSAAVSVTALQLFLAWFAGRFNVMDTAGWTMLLMPATLAGVGAWIGAVMRRRQQEEDANAFVPPPPPQPVSRETGAASQNSFAVSGPREPTSVD